MHQRPMVPDHGTQYEEHSASHHGGMCKDEIDPFLYSLIPLRLRRGVIIKKCLTNVYYWLHKVTGLLGEHFV